MKAAPRQPLDVRDAIPALEGGGIRGFLRETLEHVLGLPETRARFAAAAARPGNPFRNAAEAFGLEIRVSGADLPVTGPLCVVANHPFGGADALALGSVCIDRRPDARIMANRLVAQLPGVGARMLPLSIMGSEAAARENIGALRQAISLLRSGSCLAVFPAGEVAHWSGAGLAESPWSAQIVALIRKTGATVVPVAFPGINPAEFHLLGGIHPMVRTALLPRMLLRRIGTSIEMRIGECLRPHDFPGLDDVALAAFLRRTTLDLARM